MAAPLFLLSRGRTGTTLMQRLLNTHPAVLMLGEHAGVLAHLAQLRARLLEPALQERLAGFRPSLDLLLSARAVPRVEGDTTEWTNSLLPAEIDAACRGFVETLLLPPPLRPPGLRRWGFKEIRYDVPAATMLWELWPDARFIVLLRDPLAVARSQLAKRWWLPGEPAQVALRLHRDAARLHDMAEALVARDGGAGRVCIVDYAQLQDDPVRLITDLGRWLDLPPFPGAALTVALEGGAERRLIVAQAELELEDYAARYLSEDRAAWTRLRDGASPLGLAA